MQDRVPLAWASVSYGLTEVQGHEDLARLDTEIERCLGEIHPRTPEIEALLHAIDQKQRIITSLVQRDLEQPTGEIKEHCNKIETEVSLSSSGMGFFSQRPADQDQEIEICMFLDTVNLNICLNASVLESRVSADSENPGFWLRVRFNQQQNKEINSILAHVTNRQIERLKRREEC